MNSYVDILQNIDLNLGPMGVSFLLGIITILLLYWYSIRRQSYWKKIGIPYVKPYPFFGSVLDHLIKRLHDLEFDRYNKYGKIYGYYEGNRPVLSVAEPEILRSILVKDFHAFTGRRRLVTGHEITDNMLPMLQGEDWKRVRVIVTPTFTTGKLKKMMSIFKDCSRTIVKNFKEVLERGESIEVRRFYGAFTMDIIASSAFSTKIDSHNDPNNKFVKAARDVFSKAVSWRFFILFLLPGIMKYIKLSVFPLKSLQFFSDVTLQIIEERKRTGQTRNDFLQLLLDTTEEIAQEGKLDLKDEDDIMENYRKEENDEVFKNYYSKNTLSQDELVAQCVIFFLAGYETTTSALCLVTYELALNPDIQEKLIQEIDEALRANKGELTYEALQSMKYLDNVISETMRLYPLSIRLERFADEDYKLGDTGLIVPKGMILSIPVYAIHRDPNFFPNPEKFDPDRFTLEERAKRNPYVYMPFGVGPRNCVGMRFALLEIKVCLAYVFSNFRVKKCSETTVPLEFYTGQGILKPENVTLLMEVRKDTVKAL